MITVEKIKRRRMDVLLIPGLDGSLGPCGHSSKKLAQQSARWKNIFDQLLFFVFYKQPEGPVGWNSRCHWTSQSFFIDEAWLTGWWTLILPGQVNLGGCNVKVSQLEVILKHQQRLHNVFPEGINDTSFLKSLQALLEALLLPTSALRLLNLSGNTSVAKVSLQCWCPIVQKYETVLTGHYNPKNLSCQRCHFNVDVRLCKNTK